MTGRSIASVAIAIPYPNTGKLTLTLDNGDVLSGCSADDVYSGTTPTLYTLSGNVRTYGKVVKSIYDYLLIHNDRSNGVHYPAFVDAMQDAMVNHLDSVGLPK